MWKYGHGNWESIQKDKTLGLEDKFFLEDAKMKGEEASKRQLPNSIHLVRRADYLTHLLKEHHDSKGGPSRSGSSRPAPRPKATTERSHDSSSKPKSKRKATPDYSSSDDSAYDSMDEKECKEILRPVKRELKRLKLDTASYSREQKVAHLKECLSAIGARIDYSASQEKSSSAKDKRRKHLCACSSSFRARAERPLTFLSSCRGLDVSLLPRQGPLAEAARAVRFFSHLLAAL